MAQVLVTVDYSKCDTDGQVLVIVEVILIAQVLVTVDYSNSNTDGLVLVIVVVILIAQALVRVDYSNSNTAGLVLVIVVIILIAQTAVQRAMTLLTGSLDAALKALTALPLLLQPPNRLHWQFLMEMRERFLMAGSFAKCLALWSLVLVCNDVPEARLTCAVSCCLQILNLHCSSAFACFLLSSSLYMVMLQSRTVAVFMGFCFPIAGKKASMPTPELRRHKATGTASIRWRIRAGSVLQEHQALFQQHGMPEEDSSGHTLETTGMPLAEAENMLRRLKETIRQLLICFVNRNLTRMGRQINLIGPLKDP